MRARHFCEPRSPFQADGVVPQRLERGEVAAWATPEVEDRPWWRRLDVTEQRLDVLADVVVARAEPEGFGAVGVVRKRAGGAGFQVGRGQCHRTPTLRHETSHVATPATATARRPSQCDGGIVRTRSNSGSPKYAVANKGGV